MSKTFTLEASVINGELLSFPVPLVVPCDAPVIGEQCRSFTDMNECTTRKEFLYVLIAGSEYGLDISKADYYDLKAEKCKPCSSCGRRKCACISITINGCVLTVNQKEISLKK